MDPVSQLANLIADYGYLFLFLAVVFEGPIATAVGGFFAGQGAMNLWLVVLFAIAGDLSGDFLYYFLGRWGRNGFFDKWGRYFGVTKAKIAGVEKYFKAYSGRIILLSKLSHGIGTVFLVTAGVARMPKIKFFLYNLAGTLPKSILLIYIGFFFGSALSRVDRYLDILAWFSVAAAAVLAFIYWLTINFTRKIEKKLEVAADQASDDKKSSTSADTSSK